MLRSRLRLFLLVLVLAAIAASPIEAAPVQRVAGIDAGIGGTGAISGQIIVPVPGFWDYIEVILEYETGIPVAYTHTNGNGEFSFKNLQPGRYTVLVELDGFDPVRERMDVRPEESDLPKQIYLVPDGEKAAAAELRRKYPKKAVDEFEKGQDELKKGNLAKAVQRLTAALKEEPKFFEAQLLLGTVHYKLHQMPEAEIAYRKAKDLNPQATLPLMNLGQIYIEAADASAGRDPAAAAKVYTAAYELLSQAAKLDPKSATGAFLLGVSCYKSGRTDEAESNLLRALELSSRMGQAQVMLANVYIRKQNWDGALKTLDAYLKNHGNGPDAKPIQETRAKVAERLKATGK